MNLMTCTLVLELLKEDQAFPSAKYLINRNAIDLKKDKVEKFLLHSKANGTLDANNLKEKADKWDDLEKKVAKFYFDEDGNELPGNDDDVDGGLLGIGETAATAFGYLLKNYL